jgi:cell division protein FtsI/penicillin-binding protein 2
VAVAVSGKTGTAEVGRGETRRKNAWFIAYAPSGAPTAAVAMVVENGESGGGTAAPRVRNVLAAMFGETGTKEAAKR